MSKPKEPPFWWPMFSLPNLQIRFPIEIDGFALVPVNDFRIEAIKKKQPRLGSFLKRFKTEFGDPVAPSTIIWRRDKPDTYRTIGAISGFRDLISMSIIPLSWAKTHQFGRVLGPMYSDTFAVYPWMIDKLGEGLITQTPSLWGYHEVKRLRGQTTAALSVHQLDRREVDLLLMNELLKRWERCFSAATPSVEDERLFRSLNMANAAAKLPAGADTNLYDVIRSVALWASAFEILYPANNQAFKRIYAALESITWNLSDCSDKNFQVFGDRKGPPRSLPVWLFGEINSLRNDALHGNPISQERLVVPPAKQPLHMFAAPLYRMILTAYLDLKLAPRRPIGDRTKYENFLLSHFESGEYQRHIEAGLSAIVFTSDEYRAKRQRRASSAWARGQEIRRAVEDGQADGTHDTD
ncbi:hypothetical protein ACQR0Z_11310 [Bradyrhizobium sp. HKCCYLS3077]|uniref:hypothetical protein n=1 Tax=Bradyrhizobium sp. HKCCYLS3077 TaxID=3420761 RepID=UPI003EBDD821